MPFKFKPVSTFKATVDVTPPGESQAASFTAEFVAKDEGEIRALTDAGDEHFVRTVLKGWEGDLQDHDGNEIPFTPENVDTMVTTVWIRNAMADAYFRHMGGRRGKTSR